MNLRHLNEKTYNQMGVNNLTHEVKVQPQDLLSVASVDKKTIQDLEPSDGDTETNDSNPQIKITKAEFTNG